MIWTSLPLMTAIDLVIIVITGAALWSFVQIRGHTPLLAHTGPLMIISGLLCIALFYLTDLATMHALPLFVPMAEAMAIMDSLHQNYSWLIILLAVSLIGVGLRADFTERKRAEEAVREREERHRELFELSPIGVLEEDYSGAKRMIDRLREEGVRDFRQYFREHPKALRQMVEAIKVIDVNRALLDICRAPDKETFVQWEANPARIDSWMSFYEQELAALAEGETRFALEHADKTFDGSDIVIRSITNIGEAYKDSWARVVSTTEDITERTEAEKARRETEQRLADITANMPGSIFRRVLHTDGKISFPYYATGAVHDLDPKAVMEDPDVFIDTIHPDDRAKWHEAIKASAEKLERFDLEMRLVTPSGETRWGRSMAQPHRLDNGEVVWDGVMTDITEQKRTEDALRESEGRYRDLFELSPIGIWEEDYSAVKPMIDRLRRKGVRDFRRYFREHPRVLRQMEAIKEIVNVNQALLDIYRAPNQEVFLQAAANPSRMENWGGFYENELTALAEGKTRFTLEYPDKALDGSDIVTRTVTHIGEAYKDNWTRVVSTVEDITERKRAEEALRESEQRHRELFEHSPIGIWEEDYSGAKRIVDRLRKKGVREFRRYFREHPKVLRQAINAIKIIDVNPALIDIYRAPDKEAFVQWDENVARTGSWMSFYEQELAALAAGETRFALEYAARAFDGSDNVLRVITSIGEAHKDNWARVVSTTEDITERTEAEEALRESEGRYRELFDQSPVSIWEEDWSAVKKMIDELARRGVKNWDAYFRRHPDMVTAAVDLREVIDVSQATLEIYRAPSKEAVIDSTWASERTPDELEAFRQQLIAFAQGETQVDKQVKELALDGSEVVTRIQGAIPPRDRDRWARVIYAITDITERKRAEEALGESEGRFRSLAANLPGVVFQRRLTSDGRLVFTYVSPGMRELYGVEPEKVIADSSAFLQVLPAEDRDRYLAALQHSARTLSPMDLELRVVSADGGTQWQRTISRPFRRESGEVVWNGVAIDITEQKRAEQSLREHEKELAEVLRRTTMGEMASALAHEINQPLAAARNYAGGCRHRIESGKWKSGELVKALKGICEQTERASAIISRISHFVRRAEPKTKAVSVDGIIRSALSLAEAELRKNKVEVRCELTEGLPPILVDEVEIEQVALNLVLNAIEAMTNTKRRQRKLTVRTSMADDGAIEAAVSDTGPGLAVDSANKAFEPLYTTKPDGMGMGLSISRTIVEAHGGHLWATQNTRRGSTFHFTLPIAPEEHQNGL